MQFACPPIDAVPEAMDWERFRREAHKVVDFIGDYHASLKENAVAVRPDVEPNFLKTLMPSLDMLQHESASAEVVLSDVQRYIMPGITHFQHPNFFAFFPVLVTPGALMGDMLSGCINQPGFSWICSPSATELEVRLMNWFASALGVPAALTWNGTGGGVLQPSATEAAIIAVLAAKNRALESCPTIDAKSALAGKLVLYVSDQAHFCMEKAARIMSIWHIRHVPTKSTPDGNCPMTGNDLATMVEKDIRAGLHPFFVSANYGTTGVCAVDDFDGIAAVCKQHNMWLNIDGAYAGVTALCPEMRAAALPAFNNADSLFVNGSKWLGMMVGSTFFYFRERKYVVASLNATGTYLDNKFTEENAVVDFKDYHLGLCRPFRALKVYTALRYMGVEGLQTVIRRHTALATYLYRLLDERSHGMLDMPMGARFALVCFCVKDDPRGEQTEALYQLMDKEKHIMLSPYKFHGTMLLRLVLSYPALTEKDIESVADYVVCKLNEVVGKKAN